MNIENLSFDELVTLKKEIDSKLQNYRTGDINRDFEIVNEYGREECCLINENNFPIIRGLFNVLDRQIFDNSLFNRYEIIDVFSLINILREQLEIYNDEDDEEKHWSYHFESFKDRNILQDSYLMSSTKNPLIKELIELCSRNFNISDIFKDTDTTKHVKEYLNSLELKVKEEAVKNNLKSFQFDW